MWEYTCTSPPPKTTPKFRTNLNANSAKLKRMDVSVSWGLVVELKTTTLSIGHGSRQVYNKQAPKTKFGHETKVVAVVRPVTVREGGRLFLGNVFGEGRNFQGVAGRNENGFTTSRVTCVIKTIMKDIIVLRTKSTDTFYTVAGYRIDCINFSLTLCVYFT